MWCSVYHFVFYFLWFTNGTFLIKKNLLIIKLEQTKEVFTNSICDRVAVSAVIGGAVVGLLCAILVVMFIVYRMRKKDEGSYALDEPKRSPTVNSYTKNSNREFYAWGVVNYLARALSRLRCHLLNVLLYSIPTAQCQGDGRHHYNNNNNSPLLIKYDSKSLRAKLETFLKQCELFTG